MDNGRYLYRGVSTRKYAELEGRLRPGDTGAFEYTFHWDEPGATWNSGITWGSSETNAVIRHQLNQEGFPTAGVSTTPHLERATIYARGPHGDSPGFVYKIDRGRLSNCGVRQYVVAEWVRDPSVPEDVEVILVAEDGGDLPEEIVVGLIAIQEGPGPPEDGCARETEETG